ncbi:hypothetical protein [Brevibacillus laterosporus]|uniref:Uncharacterized protein n=1 Tax=Brevibacillus laterosporus TaxID=1465 RepID=A0AAP3DMQ7_BRELA|nr:hypothetical protein [Brevibacillus laterosporus]MBG9788682.1 hypothetical protein [Brevibacillus laterosporus]MCR8983364.1 hypothetical protein [Brevibacillus laterosporus]MCZ0810520.1 hypothetical protein [Brevibacillus laterosporus]MCZ0829093.1 hypothetical protein [Brevibacillus laterosporus]MCZ0853156.1 hypothetical protein [Brevibacillus laterosporus]
MPNLTPRLKLKKPLPNEVADIAVLNENFDKIDQQMLTVGENNQAVNPITAIELKVDTRTMHLTYTSGRLTKVEEKDGSTVVKTTTIDYTTAGKASTVRQIAGKKTVTQTLNYGTNGALSSVSKAVI